MKNVLLAFLSFLISTIRKRNSLQLEILALRQQLAVLKQKKKRPHIRPADRILWAWLSKFWSGWRNTLIFVQPETVINWQHKRFREHWAKLSQGKAGRPKVEKELRDLI